MPNIGWPELHVIRGSQLYEYLTAKGPGKSPTSDSSPEPSKMS